MPKPGSERRARRRARQAAETRAEADLTNGHGEHWEGGLTDQALLRRAIRERWVTDATADDVTKILSNPKTATVKELAVALIRRGMLFGSKGNDDRPIDPVKQEQIVQSAIKNLLSMESQNQKDELAELQRETPQQHEHHHAVQIVLPHNGRDDIELDALSEADE